MELGDIRVAGDLRHGNVDRAARVRGRLRRQVGAERERGSGSKVQHFARIDVAEVVARWCLVDDGLARRRGRAVGGVQILENRQEVFPTVLRFS